MGWHNICGQTLQNIWCGFGFELGVFTSAPGRKGLDPWCEIKPEIRIQRPIETTTEMRVAQKRAELETFKVPSGNLTEL